MSRFSMKFVLQGSENFWNALHMDEAAVILQDLQEAAHVGTLELVG